MIEFDTYLKRKGNSTKTRISYIAQTNHYLHWLNKQQVLIIETSNNDLLAYIKYCKRKGNSQRTIQNRLTSISHYYDHLKKLETISHNPTSTIEIKGIKRNTLYHIIEAHKLNDLYHQYPPDSYREKSITQQRNKVILGLIVYQGLLTEELGKLTTKDLNVRAAEIMIPRSRKHNERTLKLESHQVLDMYDYLQQVRSSLAEGKDIEQLACRQGRLFFNSSGSTGFSIIMRPIIKWLKSNQIESLNQIRASVITKWLKMHNLREAQYLAGHRYISSTEHYLQHDLEGLQEEINQYHPLG